MHRKIIYMDIGSITQLLIISREWQIRRPRDILNIILKYKFEYGKKIIKH